MQLNRPQWESNDFLEFQQYFKEQSDEKYRQFNEKLLNTQGETLGIRVPVIRKIAKEILKGNPQGFIEGFTESFTPQYHEEKVLFACILTEIPLEYQIFLDALDEFLPQVDNWAICDILCGNIKKPLRMHKEEFFEHIPKYLSSPNPWIIRVGIVSMLSHYMEGAYLAKCLSRVNSISHSFYYVKIAQAWLIATAMAKQPDVTKEFLSHCDLDSWTFNKAVQKSRESYRVSVHDKAVLLQWKNARKEKEKEKEKK